jgi:hypothetical protein
MYARVQGKNITVATIDAFFPHTTFLNGVPDEQFLAINGLNKILETKSFNVETECLEPCAVYAENGQVYSVRARALTAEEIEIRNTPPVTQEVQVLQTVEVQPLETVEIQELSTVTVSELSTTSIQNLTTTGL